MYILNNYKPIYWGSRIFSGKGAALLSDWNLNFKEPVFDKTVENVAFPKPLGKQIAPAAIETGAGPVIAGAAGRKRLILLP